MATRTTTSAGDWSDTGTWVSGTKPSTGDDVVILHDVTVDEAINIGAGTAATDYACLTITDATLTFAPSLSHTIKGGIVHEGAAIFEVDSSTGSGVTIEFDCAAAYEWRTANGHNSGAKVILTGGASSRVTIQSKSGGSNIWIRDGDDSDTYLQGGMIQAQYVNFTRIGDASNALARISATGDSTVFFLNCQMDSCGQIAGFYNIGADAIFRVEDCHFANSVGDSVMQSASNVSKDTGTRTFLRNSCDKIVYFYAPYGWDIQGNTFLQSYGCSNGEWGSFYDNLVVVDAAIAPLNGNISDSVFIHTGTGDSNPHFIQAGYYTGTLDGNVFFSAYTGSDGEGDCILLATSGDATVTTITHNIVLPTPGGSPSGTLFSCLGNSNITVAANHNSGYCGTQALGSVGEDYAGHSGMISSFKSNIAIGPGSSGYKLWDSGTDDSVTDLVSASGADYNCGYGLAGNYFHLEFTGSPGASDIDEDPGFVDDTVSPITFDDYLGGAGTLANLLSEFSNLSTGSYNSDYNVADLLSYIRAGFTPTNPNLDSAGHDGADIGAVSFTPSAGNNVDAPSVSITITANAPTVTTTENHFATIPASSLTIATNAPTITTTENHFVDGALATMSLTANAPTVSTTENHFVTIPLATVTITANAPTVTNTEHNFADIPSVALSMGASAPTATTTENHFVSIPVATLAITTRAPTVNNGVDYGEAVRSYTTAKARNRAQIRSYSYAAAKVRSFTARQ